MNHIGMAIKKRRLMMGMRVKELADAAQVSASYIYAIESHQRGKHLEKLLRIARVLKLECHEIIELFE